MSEGFVKVADVSEVPEQKMKRVQLGGDDVLLANVGGKFYAMGAVCTHRGGPLDEGELEGTTVTCPFHGGQFDVTSGKTIRPPPMKDEPAYEVRVEGPSVLLRKKG